MSVTGAEMQYRQCPENMCVFDLAVFSNRNYNICTCQSASMCMYKIRYMVDSLSDQVHTAGLYFDSLSILHIASEVEGTEV